MAPSKQRQRELERAKLDRRLVRRAAQARRARQVRAAVAAGIALVVVVVGAVWLAGGFSRKPKPTTPAAATTCVWSAADPKANTDLRDTGTPPKTSKDGGRPRQMTLDTTVGTVDVTLDGANAPCAAASFGFLAGKKFFDGTSCDGLSTVNPYVYECGDPAGTGKGGPSYTLPDENLPPAAPASAAPGASASPTASASYPAGTVALVTNGPGTGGSRFFIMLKDSTFPAGSYPIVGQVTAGLDKLAAAAKAGAVDKAGKTVAAGAPKTKVTLKTVTVSSAGARPSAQPSS